MSSVIYAERAQAGHERRQDAGARWAARLVASGDFAILAIQATHVPGNHADAELCQIAVMDGDGSMILNTLVRPRGLITREATRIHGISNEMVARARGFAEVYPWLREVLDDRVVVIYNAPVVEHVLDRCCQVGGLRIFTRELWCDAMEYYAEWVGEEGPYPGTYRNQSLPGAGQGARYDCEAVLHLLMMMSHDVAKARRA